MKMTAFQKEVLRSTRMSRVFLRDMWQDEHQLGYADKGDRSLYNINVAKDAPYPTSEVKNITLIHEASHIYFRHVDVNIAAEFEYMEKLLKKAGKTVDAFIATYGGFMNFLNICADLEVNSKSLTISNVKVMNEALKNAIGPEGGILTPDTYDLDVLDSFRDYYVPLIEKIDNNAKSQGNGDSNENEEGEEDGNSQGSGSGKGKGKKQKNRDLPQKITQEEMKKLSEAAKEALKKEGVIDEEGNIKKPSNKKGGDEAEETTVGELADEIAREADDEGNSEGSSLSPLGGSGIGSSEETASMLEVGENSEENLKEFFKSILTVDPELTRQEDCMRIWNRGTRDRGNGLMYTSMRRRYTLTPKKKLGVLIDISGSMPLQSITSALATLKDLRDVLDDESLIVTWNHAKSEEFTLNNIPTYIRNNGGTEMGDGVRYLLSKGLTDIVVYSDFETNYDSMKKAQDSSKANLYSICVDTGWCSGTIKEFKAYFDRCKKNIFVK